MDYKHMKVVLKKTSFFFTLASPKNALSSIIPQIIE